MQLSIMQLSVMQLSVMQLSVMQLSSRDPWILTDHQSNLASRLWRKDASLWRPSADGVDAIEARLGWLDSIKWMRSRTGELRTWAGQVAQSGRYDRAILLGMGGSSLAPAVFASLFEPAPGYLPLAVMDTTHPDEIARIAGGDLRRCLFIVSSKSGTTVETVDLYQFFRAQLATQCADPRADSQSRFVMITDEGSDLHRLGQSDGCHNIFLNPDDVGGRYSALSYFGLAPAALLGVEVGELINRAGAFCETTKSDHPAENPALALGMLLGRSAPAGRDKLILRLPRRLGVFGLWVEQLIAESTGKHGKGLVPVVVANDLNNDLHYHGEDRINIRYDGDRGDTKPRAGQTMEWALQWDDPYQLGAEYFRWEFATAIAASYLGVNPFDQPDVARSKNHTHRFIRGHGKIQPPAYRGDDYDLHWRLATAPVPAMTPPATCPAGDVIAEFCRTLKPGAYLGLLAYLPEDDRTLSLLQSLGAQAAARWGIVTTLGFGPRYLHSTGQLHKGGPPTGRFIQFIADPETDIPVPRRDYTFGQLYRAQADGDFSALVEGGGAVMRVRLKADRLRALAAFVDQFTGRE